MPPLQNNSSARYGQPPAGVLDILHLCVHPPFAPGSYNRMIGVQMKRLSDLRQAVASYWDGPVPDYSLDPQSIILGGTRDLPAWTRAAFRLPQGLRSRFFQGVADPCRLAWLALIRRVLPRLRPRLVVCYDDYKIGPLLRPMVHWPCRLIFSQHGLSYHGARQFTARLYSLSSFDVICTLTYASYRADRDRLGSYEPLVAVIPNGVNTARFKAVSLDEKRALRAKWGLPLDKQIVLSLGRLVPKKGAHVIVTSWPQVLAKTPDAFLWIVGAGDPSYYRYLQQLAGSDRLGDSVRFQGSVDSSLSHECFQASDVYVFPSLWVEGMPLSLLEAMACELATVASSLVVTRELFSGKEAHFIPDPNIQDAFVAPILRLLDHPQARADMGRLAREVVCDKYSEELWLARLDSLYRSQLELVPNPQP
ncbi:MAG: glycosyltransferase family 4 protein [Limisphaerales bacterium]